MFYLNIFEHKRTRQVSYSIKFVNRLWQNWLAMPNILAYYTAVLVTSVKSFIVLGLAALLHDSVHQQQLEGTKYKRPICHLTLN
jgi:hypothetical protein